MSYISFDPWHQKENGRFGFLSGSELNKIIRDVNASWMEWRLTPAKTKRDLLINLGNKLMEEKQYHARSITSEMGKVITQSLAEVEKCASLCFYYAENIGSFSSPERRASSGRVASTVSYEPQGIIFGIMPWNFPYWQAFRFIIPVVAGGNSIILKHASNVPHCALNIEKIFSDAGFPENICRNVFADYDQVEKIISAKEVRGISLTGSNAAGVRIAAMAGKYLKKCIMELGGSDPFIVFPDADLQKAADAAVFARFQNCGQSCIAAKRFFIHQYVYDSFIDLFTDSIKSRKVGDPYENENFMGPLVSDKALDEIDKQVKGSVSMGAELITGGKRLSDAKPLYSPTVLKNVPELSPVMTEEVFGPVAPVSVFTNEDEAIKAANSTVYGLGASIWTADMERANRVSLGLDTGTVAVNGFVRSDPALPFGGVKDSGFGRELSVEGFREFLNIKALTIFG